MSFKEYNFHTNADVHISAQLSNTWTHPLIYEPASHSHPVVLDKLLHIILSQVIGLDVGLDKLLVGDGSQVRQLFQLHQELLEVQLHQGPALVAAFLHVCVATAEDREAGREALL